MCWRLGFATAIGLVALVVLACGPSGHPSIESGSGTEVIAPATQRPLNLDGFLQLPDTVQPVAFPWSEVTVRRSIGDLRVGVLVADNGTRRTRGLMYWSGLPQQAGMLFIWEDGQPRSLGFWNRNVPMDLHVAWLDEDGTILGFATLIAFDEQIKHPPAEYYHVLEMPRGRFEELGIAVGDRVLIPQTLLAR